MKAFYTVTPALTFALVMGSRCISASLHVIFTLLFGMDSFSSWGLSLRMGI